MKESKQKDPAEDNVQQLHRLTAEMADLLKDIRNLKNEMTKLQEEYATLP